MKKHKEICPNCSKKPIFCKNLCHNCYTKQLEKENPKLILKKKEYIKQWRINNKEKIKESEKRRNQERSKDINYQEKRKNAYYIRKYQITLQDYRNILKYQNFKCAICEVKIGEGIKHTHVDHCHKTGNFRGILCSQCNWFMSKIDTVQNTFFNLKNYINNKGILWKKQ